MQGLYIYINGAKNYISKSSIAKNAASLYLIQFAELLLPLITIPYVVRVLGADGFGKSGFILGMIAYFVVFVDYGFAMSATRAISVNRQNSEEVNRIYSGTLLAKSSLFVLGLVILCLLYLFVPRINEMIVYFLAGYLSILGNIIFPVWLYQGMERMGFLAISNLIAKIIMVVSIFVFINSPNDVLKYILILSGTQILNGAIAFIKAQSLFKVKFINVGIVGIKRVLKDGWTLFLSNASISLYTAGNPFILGFFAPMDIVGYYTAAEKIARASLGLISPLTQAIYPNFAKIGSESKEQLFIVARKALYILGGVGLAASLLVFVFAPLIVRLFLGNDYEPSILPLRILSSIPLFVALSNLFGIQIMLPLKEDRAFTVILLLAGLVNFVLIFIFAPILGAVGSAIAFTGSEFFIALAMAIYLYNLRRSMMRKNLHIQSEKGNYEN